MLEVWTSIHLMDYNVTYMYQLHFTCDVEYKNMEIFKSRQGEMNKL
jgi:hypothetical protein